MAPEHRLRWRRAAVAGGLLWALALPAGAQQVDSADSADPLAPLPFTEIPATRSVLPNRHGYAFDHPDILLRQRLIGLAHGLRLLGKACLMDPTHSLATEQAYAQWYRQQGDAIDAMSLDLERWYFGTAVPQPEPQLRLRDIVRLIGLRSDLRELSADELQAACGSFPQAIAAERYDLAKLLESAAQELAAQRAELAKPVPAAAKIAEPETDVEPMEIQVDETHE